MKLVQKPDGYDFTNKRSDVARDGALWRPEDALYDAQQEMLQHKATSLLVCWIEQTEEGNSITHFRFSGQTGSAQSLLLSVMGKLMGWASG